VGFLNVRPELEKILVVCPASLKINWERELGKWLISPCQNVQVTNFERLPALGMGEKFDAVLVDEAHYIKNVETQRAQLCSRIDSPVRIAMTGSPVINRTIELFGILSWLRPDLFNEKTRKSFATRYCNGHVRTVQFWKRTPSGPKLITKYVWDESGSSNLEELRFKLSKIMLRRTKAGVLPDLPPKFRQVIELPEGDFPVDLTAALEARERELTYASQVSTLEDTVTARWDELASLRHQTALLKARRAIPFLKDCIDASQKVVIFCHHRDVIDTLWAELQEFNPVVLHGGHTETHRQKAVDFFQTDPSYKVFIGQIQAAGVGLTLTAASHVVFLELDWSPMNMTQCEDRLHRIGQLKSVLVQHLVVGNSLDARIARMLVRKQSIIDQVVRKA
jgi:SWI/SNF-related matrix-associated actin-dependent regulator of chromatin subfamily A-like protein 1